jgi:Pyruvate/2-oxoacid:ferredoxin oxidoreductase gamma subunit
MIRPDGVLNLVIAGFPYHDLGLIVDVLSRVAVDRGIPCSGMALYSRDTFGIRPASYHLRLGEQARSAYIPAGEGDILLGVEAGSAARFAAEAMGSHGQAVINTWQYHPPFETPYPSVDQVLGMLRRLLASVLPVDGIGLAEKAGDKRLAHGLVDCAMLGALSGAKFAPFSAEAVEKTLAMTVRPEERERMVQAFRLGVEAAAAQPN